jgi:putative membrane protein
MIAVGLSRRMRASQGREDMRWFHMTVIAVLAAAMLIFAFQNLQTVTVAFLGFRLSAPLAVLIAVVYVLGMATGGSLWAMFRWALEGSKRPATP